MVSVFSALPAAVFVDEQLSHFGNPFQEQRALLDQDTAQTLAVLPSRSVVSVSGSDRLSWLDSMTSQALKQLQAGDSTETLFLDPHGHIEFAAGVVDDGERTLLFLNSDGAPKLAQFLNRMRFRMDVTVSELPGVVVGARFEVLRQMFPDAAIWRDPWPEVFSGGFSYSRPTEHPGHERDWAELLLSDDELVALGTDPSVSWAGPVAADALRIAAWRPSGAAEVVPNALPHEFDWLRTAVHLNKGCYRGQETVAKIHNLGHPPRRVVFVHLDGSQNILPAPGDDLYAAEHPVGVLTSVANHFELGPVALALVKRNLPQDAVVTVRSAGGVVGAQLEEIVAPDAGAEANVPRIPRLNRRARGQR